ncbi:hypothetical protein AGMMS50276_32100 [Synergistales bacterium]|nr:hypothetical protein AGMMS50276_32100 [Synergistales bacterium]
MESKLKIIKYYSTDSGFEPFIEWLSSFKDYKTRDAIRGRIARLGSGNPGQYKDLGDGLLELKLVGLGLRVYYAEIGDTMVLILGGGGKNTKKDQSQDIAKTREYWEEFNKRAEESQNEHENT